MNSSQIGAFEYVSILVSIILGLGITQILSSFADLLYDLKKIRFYWPHSLWLLFILFLHIQDWFVTYELKGKPEWSLPELIFVLSYPISLFMIAKMLLPPSEYENRHDMKLFYKNQFPLIFLIVAVSITLSILFNILLLGEGIRDQWLLVLFLVVMIYMAISKNTNETVHRAIALMIGASMLLSIVLERHIWVIK